MRRWLLVATMLLATPAAAFAMDPNTWQTWWCWVMWKIIWSSGGTIW